MILQMTRARLDKTLLKTELNYWNKCRSFENSFVPLQPETKQN